MIEYFMPSEIARLVLGYLKYVNCKNTASAFLQECIHIKEYYECLQSGAEYGTNIGGRSLIDILNEYCVFKSADRENFSPEGQRIFDKLKNVLKHTLQKQQNVNHMQNTSVNSLNNQNALLQKKQTRCAIVTAQRQCTVKEQHVTTLDKGINTEAINKSQHSYTGEHYNSIQIQTEMKDTNQYQGTCKDSFSTSIHSSHLMNDFSSENADTACKNNSRTWKDTASSPIELEDFILKTTPIKISSACTQSYSLSYSLQPKDETPQKNIFSEDSNFRSPRRKSQLPKKKSQVSTPQSAKKRGNLSNDYDNLDLQNEESLSVILEHAMSNTALHEKIAETINKVVSIPTALPEQPKEAQHSMSSLPQTGELQDVHVTESLIKDILNRTESDPVFEELLCMLDNGKAEDNASSFDITAPLTPLLTENVELFNKASQEMMEGIENESLENKTKKLTTQNMEINHMHNNSPASFQTMSEQRMNPVPSEQILFAHPEQTFSSPVISPSLNEPSAFVEISTSYTPVSGGDMPTTSSHNNLTISNFDSQVHQLQSCGIPSNENNQSVINTTENSSIRNQEMEKVTSCHSENLNKSEGNTVYIINQDDVRKADEERASTITDTLEFSQRNCERGECTPPTRNVLHNDDGLGSSDKIENQSSLITGTCNEKTNTLLSTATLNIEASCSQQIAKPQPLLISNFPQSNLSSPIFVTSTSEAIANMQLLTFPPGSSIFGSTSTLAPNSNLVNVSPNGYVIINCNNNEQNKVQNLTQRNQQCRIMKVAKPVRRSIPRGQGRIEHHAIRSLNFHSEETKTNTKKNIPSQISRCSSGKKEAQTSEERIPLDQAMNELINATVNPDTSTHSVEIISSKILKASTAIAKQPSTNVTLSTELQKKSKTKSPQLKTLVNSAQKICKPTQCRKHVRVLEFGTPEKSQAKSGQSLNLDRRNSTKRKNPSPEKTFCNVTLSSEGKNMAKAVSVKKKLTVNNMKKLKMNSETDEVSHQPIPNSTANEKDNSGLQKHLIPIETEKMSTQKHLQGTKTKNILHNMDVEKFLAHLHYIE